MRTRLLIAPIAVLAAVLWLAPVCTAGDEETDNPSDSADARVIDVQRDAEVFTTRVTITARDGRVDWSDILAGLCRARGYDDEALAGLLPSRTLSISDASARFRVALLNTALAPSVQFDVVPADDERPEPLLAITLDRRALLASERRFKRFVRDAFARAVPGAGRKGRFGLALDDKWADAPIERNLVVSVHGINSSADRVDTLLDRPRKEGYPCAAFQYPNDQPIEESAKLLAKELARVRREQPERGVTLVAHSMGGLVSREMIENPELDPGNVRQLIMIATPNHGSTEAHFAFCLDFLRLAVHPSRYAEIDAWAEGIEDGLAEAANDVQPDSVFLRTLNARPRNPDVRYSLILGDSAPCETKDLELVRRKLAEAGEENRWVRLFGSRLDTHLSDLHEVIDREGDGAVSLERGRLDGVDDVVVLRFGHSEVVREGSKGDAAKVLDLVFDRIAAPATDAP